MMSAAWTSLRQFTQARIAQGHSGCGLPTQAMLDFQLAHAQARDAVWQNWQSAGLAAELADQGWESLQLETQVINRAQFLQRPDLGRCLSQQSIEAVQAYSAAEFDLVIVLSNGLSSLALDQHGLGLLVEIVAAYQAMGLKIAPICLLANARVAVADQIGALLNTRLAVMVIGERPGLSAADSLGIYFSYQPNITHTDAERNCLSNIRPPAGLSYAAAAAKLAYLSQMAIQLGYSGVALKDDMPSSLISHETPLGLSADVD